MCGCCAGPTDPPLRLTPTGPTHGRSDPRPAVAHGLDLTRIGSSFAGIIDALHDLEQGTTCADERWRLEQVLDRVDRQIDELRAVRATVLATLADCDAGVCRIAT